MFPTAFTRAPAAKPSGVGRDWSYGTSTSRVSTPSVMNTCMNFSRLFTSLTKPSVSTVCAYRLSASAPIAYGIATISAIGSLRGVGTAASSCPTTLTSESSSRGVGFTSARNPHTSTMSPFFGSGSDLSVGTTHTFRPSSRCSINEVSISREKMTTPFTWTRCARASPGAKRMLPISTGSSAYGSAGGGRRTDTAEASGANSWTPSGTPSGPKRTSSRPVTETNASSRSSVRMPDAFDTITENAATVR